MAGDAGGILFGGHGGESVVAAERFYGLGGRRSAIRAINDLRHISSARAAPVDAVAFMRRQL
jgi:hypothetical protein